MRNLIVICVVLALVISAQARTITVDDNGPADFDNIQAAIDDANDGDTVIVAAGTYSGAGNRNIDFLGKAITVRSGVNPDNPDWDVVAATIIDCGGKPEHSEAADSGAANRAFWFHSGEGPNTVIMGFTIRNGWARGAKGEDGEFGVVPPINGQCVWFYFPPRWSCDAEDINGPPRAERGEDSPRSARGYGGAILCGQDNINQGIASSPCIKYCIIEDCTVTGGEGGKGADGFDAPWDWWDLMAYRDPHTGVLDLCGEPCESQGDFHEDWPDGQCGGEGGEGNGYGLGGAIACRGGSSPTITDCIFRNNIARGAVGGDGGNGGSAAGDPNIGWEGYECAGGDGEHGEGDGQGGAIYAEGGSNPIISNCRFEGNAATVGFGGKGGTRGAGNEDDPRAAAGENGLAFPRRGVCGGAAYYNDWTTANFTNCTFEDNATYDLSLWDQWEGVPDPKRIYSIGGALYMYGNGNVNLDNCDFINNCGGAVYCRVNCGVSVSNNYDPNRPCLFIGNHDPNDGDDLSRDWADDYGTGAFYIGRDSTAELRNCRFAGNSGRRAGAVDCYRSILTIANSSFSGNSAEDYNSVQAGGILGNESSIEISGCSITANASDGMGAGIYAIDTDLMISNAIVWENSPEQIFTEGVGATSITYSDIQGGWAGVGNINEDPVFVNAGYWDTGGAWVDGDYHLRSGSPCIDAGDPNYVAGPNERDLDGRPRVLDDNEDGRAVINMGAYERSVPVETEVEIKPDRLNLASKGRWVSCYIWLPEDYDVADIDVNSILLEDEVPAERVWLTDEFAVAKFSRREVQEMLGEVETPGEVELVVSGELSDGTIFEGTDTIRVIDVGGGKNNEPPGKALKQVNRNRKRTKRP